MSGGGFRCEDEWRFAAPSPRPLPRFAGEGADSTLHMG